MKPNLAAVSGVDALVGVAVRHGVVGQRHLVRVMVFGFRV